MDVGESTATHCPYCSLQCGISVADRRPSRPAQVAAANFPTNRGRLCTKGWTAAALLDHPQRLLTPLVRVDPHDRRSPLREATWAEALDRIVTAIRRAQHTYGRDSVGCLVAAD